MIKPTKLYWKVGKHVMKYLRVTTQFGLWYIRKEGVKLQSFTDLDWSRIPSDRKSTSGGIFIIRLATIYWYNKKQISMELESAEEEYIVASQATYEARSDRNRPRTKGGPMETAYHLCPTARVTIPSAPRHHPRYCSSVVSAMSSPMSTTTSPSVIHYRTKAMSC
eukprot:PITA_17632